MRQFGKVIETGVEGKVKFPTNSWDTANNISTVDRRAIPSTIGCDANKNKDIISVTFFSGYGDACVKETMGMFNSKTFMVRFRKDVMI